MLPSADHVLGQRLDRVPLEPVGALARLGNLDQLERRRTDIDADQRRRLRLENRQRGIEFFLQHGKLSQITYNLH